MRAPLLVLLLVAAAAGGFLALRGVFAESNEEPAPRKGGVEEAPPPPGAVVQLGPGEYLPEPVYITAQEIDRWVPTIACFEPDETRRSWRRKALTNVNLRRAVFAAVFPEERAAAREQALALRELLVADRPLPEDGPQLERRTGHGHYTELGLPLWGVAHESTQDVWTDVVELPGAFCVLRRLSPDPEKWLPNTPIEVEVLTILYAPEVESELLYQDAWPKLGVRALDPPGWEGILPAFYEYQ